MTSALLRRFAGLGLVAGLVLAGGCASLQPPPVAPLLHDDLFGQPPRPAEATGVMALDAGMRDFVDRLLLQAPRDRDRARRLAEALYSRVELQLEYDSRVTRNAAQAFAARSGNCLSLVLMTAALARGLGLDVSYQSAALADAYSRNGSFTVQTGHINLVLAPRQSRSYQNGVSYQHDLESLRIDFLPPEAIRGLRTVPVSEQRVLAMFMNNRAFEALQRNEPAAAYAWVREALLSDAGFWPAYNTLGVIYQRAGQPVAAAAAFEQVLAQDPDNLPAMANLAPVLRALGRDADAGRWTARQLVLQPFAPFHFLGLADAALSRGDLAGARDLLAREAAVTGDSHELFFLRARLQLAMGREGQAAAELQRALDSADTQAQRQAYAAKLQRLRALASH